MCVACESCSLVEEAEEEPHNMDDTRVHLVQRVPNSLSPPCQLIMT